MKRAFLPLLLLSLPFLVANTEPPPKPSIEHGTYQATPTSEEVKKEDPRAAAVRVLGATPSVTAPSTATPEQVKDAASEASSASPRILLAQASVGEAPASAAPVVSTEIPPTPVTIPSIETDAGQEAFAQLLFKRVVDGDWALVVVMGLILVVEFIRRYGGRLIPKLQPFLEKGGVVWLLAVLSGTAGALGNALLAGSPLTVTLLSKGILMGLAATGLVRGGQLAAKAKQNADAAGAEAGAAITTREEAVPVLAGATGGGEGPKS